MAAYDWLVDRHSPVTIRTATPADEHFLWEMLYQAIYSPPNGPPLARQILQRPELSRYVEGWMRLGDSGVIAEDQGVPIGAAWLRLMNDGEGGYGYVENGIPELTIALMPDYRGRGIGTQLLTHLLGVAASHYAAVSISVAGDNPARRLYERHGFVIAKDAGGSLTMVFHFNGPRVLAATNSS
jgi:GNAT superfamily N-acetyltransferase